jgi:outer membrane protein TolC
MAGGITGAFGGGGGQLANFQNAINQQQMDVASAATSRENTQTAIQKMNMDADNKKTSMKVEQNGFYAGLVSKINLGN